MEKICIVDTSFVTDNIGDEIIMDAVNEVVWALFPNAYISRVTSHEALSGRAREIIHKADWCFIGGTNLISSNMGPHSLWRVSEEDARIFRSTRTVLLGVGWNDYQAGVTPFTSRFLRIALSPTLIHSVRDQYTLEKLLSIGVQTISTSCMTTWNLTPSHCAEIPKAKARDVVATLTRWRQNPVSDKALLNNLRRLYRKVYVFHQQLEDAEYLDKLGFGDLPVAGATKKTYTHFLRHEDVDVVGTRLHGGIRALQEKKRALILAVDNRAAEISRDTSLPVIPRTEEDAIVNWIEGAPEISMQLPIGAIETWKKQFEEHVRSTHPLAPKARAPKPDWQSGVFGWEKLAKVRRAVWGRLPLA
jgi:polysaccharide pyruvyl transferase WcaK-like protein